MKKQLCRIAGLALFCAIPLVAAAQWQWVDRNGQKIFSDSPPPPDVPESKILKRPGARPASTAALPAASGASSARPAASSAAQAASRPASSASAAAEAQKQAAEAAARKVAEEKLAKDKAENCARAKQALATLNTGQRIRQTNAKGELEYVTDEQRAAESKRLQGMVGSDCK